MRAELRQGLELFNHAQYSDAAAKFQSVLNIATAAHDVKFRAKAMGDIGGCQFALHQYQAALKLFLEARSLAALARDTSEIAVLDANIASLYTDTGNLEAAAQWTQGALERMSGKNRLEHLPQVQIQLATLRFRQGRTAEALTLFREGIAGADRAGDLKLSALGWNRLGQERLQVHDLARAEGPLLQAYRIRKLHGLALDSSYRSLGWLRMEQGDLDSASALLDQAVELASSPRGFLPSWDMYHYRGRVRLAQGRLEEAMADLRIAIRLARTWAGLASPDDAARIGAEGWLDKVYSALIETGNRLYLKTGDSALIRETFEAADENRASSLRTLLHDPGRGQASFSAEYLKATRRLQNAEIRALRQRDSPAAEEVRAAAAALALLDASTGGEPLLPAQAVLSRAQTALGPDTALISFHLGDTASWMWAVDRAGIAVYRLPPRLEIETQVTQAARNIREDSPDADATSAGLYQTLFGSLAPRFKTSSRWLLALDDKLFETPFAALRESANPGSGYLMERHITEVIPGVAHWVEAVESGAVSPLSPVLLGVGDAIYNRADPRMHATPEARAHQVSAANLFLPRLVGSRAELDASAQAWNGESVLLEGARASRKDVIEQLARNPAVVHFATHVVESTGSQQYGLIALGLTEQGETELLQPVEIARWRIHTGLVVLSGCYSSAGQILPGTGLLGLTRAWLTAGAGAVVSTRWAMPDDTGAMFAALYRNLSTGSGSDAAGALRAAQLEMLHSQSWRARPHFWGAYFVMGKGK